MDRLLREGNPPTGQLASPKPQYKDVQTNNWEELKGEGGASYVKDKDVFAKLEQARVLLDAISGKDFATQTTLAAVLAKLADLESELATIKANQLSGDQKVQLSGTPFATLKDANGNVVSPATEDKLEQVRQLLSGVATEAKLEQARTLLDAISTKDFATASKQDALKIAVEDLKSELILVKSELANIKANQLSGDQKVQLSGTIAEENRSRLRAIAMATAPLYGGLVKMGTLTYNGEELPRPLRPWNESALFPVFRDDATTSTSVSFEGNQISITGVLWDVEMLRVGDQITVSGSNSNDGTYTLTNRTSTTLTVSETLTTEEAGASVSVTARGDIPNRAGTNLDSYSITDTSSNPENVLQWHMFYDLINGKPSLILISDRGLVANLSWNHINGSGFIFGKPQSVDGQTYLCRSLTGGAANRLGGSSGVYDGGLLPNEWDRYVMNGVDQDGPFFTGAPEPESADYQSGEQFGNNAARRRKHNQAWHWNATYTWCQETAIDDAALRTFRGYNSARYWRRISASTAYYTYVWRPVLVLEL
jgi:hypothetical protein